MKTLDLSMWMMLQWSNLMEHYFYHLLWCELVPCDFSSRHFCYNNHCMHLCFRFPGSLPQTKDGLILFLTLVPLNKSAALAFFILINVFKCPRKCQTHDSVTLNQHDQNLQTVANLHTEFIMDCNMTKYLTKKF